LFVKVGKKEKGKRKIWVKGEREIGRKTKKRKVTRGEKLVVGQVKQGNANIGSLPWGKRGDTSKWESQKGGHRGGMS